MKVSTKLALGYGLLLAIVAGLLVYHVSTVEANAAEGRRLSAATSRLLLGATDQRYWLDQMEESATKFQISGDTGYVRKFEDYAGRFDAALDTFRTVSLTPVEEERLDRLEETWQDVGLRSMPAAFDTFVPGLFRFGDAEASREPARVAAATERAFGRLRARTDSLVAASRAAMVTRVRAAEQRAQRAERVAWVGGGLVLLLSFAIWFLVVRSMAGGLRSLTAATRRVADGEFGHRLDVEGEDEFAQLSRAFNAMTERLAELDELKRNFVSRISHDLKSPLASMQEAHNLMLDEVPGELSEEQRRFLELSRENGRRLERMISKLLELARLEADVPGTEPDEEELGKLVRETAERMAPSFRRRNVELALDLPPGAVVAMCDRDQIEQLLENLLENARRYAPDGSRVTVVLERLDDGLQGLPPRRRKRLDRAAAGGEAVRLSVADAGPGVEAGDREHLFERFHHGDTSSGVGLGLALCREVARAHGGDVWVEDSPSGGAQFTVVLPREPEPDALGREPREDAGMKAVG